MAALPVALGRDLSQCFWPPKVASSLPQVSVPGDVSLVTASVCVGVSVWVSVCVCVYICTLKYTLPHIHCINVQCIQCNVYGYLSVHICVGGSTYIRAKLLSLLPIS